MPRPPAVRPRAAPHLIAAALSLAAALAAPAASAQQPDLDAQVQHGIALREAGQNDAAVEYLRGLWERSRYPRALAQLAVTEQTLGRWADADRHFREVLAMTAHPWVVQNRARVEQSLATVATHLGELEVTGAPPGTELWLDDQRVATLPTAAPIRLPAGTHALELRAEGFEVARRVVLVAPGQLTREAATLVRRLQGSPAPTPGAPVVVSVRDAGAAQRIVAWVALGLTAVGAGVGVAGMVLRASEFDALNSACYPQGSANASSQPCIDQAGRISNMALMTGVGFGAAGAFALTSLVLFVTAPPRERPAVSRVRCAPGLGAVQCAWTF